jgi:hypothetical protein
MYTWTTVYFIVWFADFTTPKNQILDFSPIPPRPPAFDSPRIQFQFPLYRIITVQPQQRFAILCVCVCVRARARVRNFFLSEKCCGPLFFEPDVKELFVYMPFRFRFCF